MGIVPVYMTLCLGVAKLYLWLLSTRLDSSGLIKLSQRLGYVGILSDQNVPVTSKLKFNVR